ncbi:BCCT family transporter [Haloprofundus halobius]|uniref:BCCT family transporter n=1 Tax=Haloprofundus halobius TaxID=2876194 RepID=UPI001CCCB9F0|nr:BCCT family transporter [Haloprofundus halobius]
MSTERGVVGKFVDELDPVVFGVGVAVSVIAVVAFIVRPDAAATALENVNAFLWEKLGWFYLLSMFALVAFVLFLTFGPWGNIKLGSEDDKAEFSYLAYFAMLYSAGIAAGIVFWGPAEAIYHFDTVPPLFGGVEAQSSAAAVGALQYTFFHWGISAWSAYCIIGIPIAYYAYRHDAPMRVSTIIAPFIGLDNLDGVWAKLVDVLAVFATIGGIATTLGLVGDQFLTGIEYTTGMSVGDLGTVLVITGLTVAFTLSVALGVDRGIRRVSNFNMALFGLLTIATFVLGPTVFITTAGLEAVGRYADQFVRMSFYMNAAGEVSWVGGWTVFYWAWWFSWAPFVGLFIARISRGRTVRQVTVTGVLASTGVTIPWFATMGGTSIFLQSTGSAEVLAAVGEYGEAGAGYPLFEALPGGEILTLLFMLLVTTFFVTSADSSTLALGMLTTGGEQRPSTINRVIWGGFMGALASLLMVVGGVSALQAAAIVTGGPFAVITLVAVVSMVWTFGDVRPVFLETTETTGSPDRSVSGLAEDDD